MSLQAKLPKEFALDVIHKKFEDKITPTTIVLLQELERYNKLIKRMNTSLAQLQKALAGEVGMSVELDDLAKSLYNGQLPSMWRSLAPATLKSLGNWIIHFMQRHAQYSSWVSACAHTYTRTHTHTLTHTHAHTHIHTHTTHTHAYTHTHTLTHMHTQHTHTHMHTHTHTHTQHTHTLTRTLTRTLTHMHNTCNTWLPGTLLTLAV